jgi:photosystem II stability/assembly factor-like uncharacterized protein
MRRFLPLALVVACVGPALLAGCGGDSPSQPGDSAAYKSIVIISGGDTLLIAETLAYTAVVLDSSDSLVPDPQLSWSTSNVDIATVNSSGVVTGVGEGSATITASGGGVTSNMVVQTVLQGSGWVGQQTPLVNNLNGVFFFDNRLGWAVGDAGRIIATDDAGVTWREQQSNATDVNLNSVFFTTPDDGWAVGTKGRVLFTEDGGRIWRPKTPIDTGGGQDLNEIRFFDDDRGVFVGRQGLIVTTDDGGDDWVRVLPTVTSVDLHSAFATTDAMGTGYAWVVGALGTTATTVDGGESWFLEVPTVTSATLTGVWRPSVLDALSVGTNNTLIKTIPSGNPASPAQWILNPPIAEFGNWYDVSWPSTAHAYLVGINAGSNAAVLKSTDEGLSWVNQIMPTNVPLAGNQLRAVWFIDANVGWAVGQGGLVVHTATGGD